MKKIVFTLLFVTVVVNAQWWIQQNSGTQVNLYNAYFFDNNVGLVVGDSGKVLKTIDGGSNWLLQTTNTLRTLYSMSFIDISNGWTVGGNIVSGQTHTIVLRTSNGGTSWNIIDSTSLSGNYLNSNVFFINSLTGFLIRNSSMLLKSTNGGYNWQQVVEAPTYISYKSVKFINSSTGYLMGYYPLNPGANDTGFVFITSNSGNNWNIVYRGPYMNLSNLFCNNNNVYVIGRHSGTLLSSMVYSTNEGGTWTLRGVTNTWVLASIFFPLQNEGYIVGSSGKIYKTSDYGSGWTDLPSGLSSNLNSVVFSNPFTGWVVGNNGKILKTTTAGVNGIINSNEIPSQFSLHQNYPNPFNPSTKIRFALPKSSFAKLVVYDALGRELETLVSEQLTAGTYEADWSADKFSSGVYYYKLTAGDYIETKKMVLIK